jgi:hypothetical protein
MNDWLPILNLNLSTKNSNIGKVKRKVQTFYGRIRDIMKTDGVKDQLRSEVWKQFAMTVTFLLNVTSIKN